MTWPRQPAEVVPGEIEAAVRQLLADELEVDEGDFKLYSSEGMAWSEVNLREFELGLAI